jgi:hypothetical protein
VRKQSLKDVFWCSQLEISELPVDRTWARATGTLAGAPAGRLGEKQCGDQVPAQPQEARSFTSRSHRRMIVPRHHRPTSSHQTASSLSPQLCFLSSIQHPNFRTAGQGLIHAQDEDSLQVQIKVPLP